MILQPSALATRRFNEEKKKLHRQNSSSSASRASKVPLSLDNPLNHVKGCWHRSVICFYHLKNLAYQPIVLFLLFVSRLNDFGDWANRKLEAAMPGDFLFVKRYAQCLVPIVVYVVMGAVSLGFVEGWDTSSSFYFAITTVTTVGYGDVAPKTVLGRLICVAYCPLSVLVLTNTGIQISNLMQSKTFSKLTLKDLLNMDTNKDGKISEVEFTIALLTGMGHVREATMELIHQQFQYLDKSGDGYLVSFIRVAVTVMDNVMPRGNDNLIATADI
jgi:hypothetical protein